MDTTEELNGTYFYGGLTNLSAGELYFWIAIDVTAEHFSGAKDVLAAAAIYSGQNSIKVSGKFKNATPGTSWASQRSRKLLRGYQIPFRLPTIVGNPMEMKLIMTHKLATFVGRAIPVIGWIVLVTDLGQIAWETTTRYNRIVDSKDSL